MSDYIKREDAERLLRYDFLSALTEDERVDELNRIPSADVVEVRHGHWGCKEVQCVFGKKFILTCSECGESVSVTEEALPEEHYCRSCGAKMDGGGDNA